MRGLPAILLLLASCSHGTATAGAHGVTGGRASELVARGAVLLDVRSEFEFFVRHVDGARNIPVDQLAARAGELGARDRPIVVYCVSGRRSAEAARLLDEAGFSSVHDAGSMLSFGGGTYVRPPPRRPRRWGLGD